MQPVGRCPLLECGQVLRELPDYFMFDADIYWLAPYRAQTPKRIRLLIDYLVDHLRNESWKIKAPGEPVAPQGSRQKR